MCYRACREICADDKNTVNLHKIWQLFGMDFKYKQHIDNLLSLGIALPELVIPNDKHSYRYIFKDIPEKNHIPQYIKKPKRALTDIEKSTATTSGYALSCFEQEDKAKDRFASLEASCRNIRKTIGDSLASGTISESDGLISIADGSTTHFDLYEYCTCNLSATFEYLCAL